MAFAGRLGAGGSDVGDEFGGQRVGLARRGAVADGDQLDAVASDQRRQRRLGRVPLLLRLVREDRAGVDDLAGAVHDGDLDAGPEAGVQAERRAVARRRGEQQVLEVLGEHRHRVLLGALPQPDAGVDRRGDHQLGAPRQLDGGRQPRRRRGLRGQVDAEGLGDHGLVDLVVTAVEGEREHLLPSRRA